MKITVALENHTQGLKLSFSPDCSMNCLSEAVKMAMTYHASAKTTFFGGLDISDIVSGAEDRRMSVHMSEEALEIEVYGDNNHDDDLNLFGKIIDETANVMNGHVNCPLFEIEEAKLTQEVVFNTYNVLITLRGKGLQILIFSLSDVMAHQLMKRFLGQEDAYHGDMLSHLKDTISEFANLVLGRSIKHSKEPQFMALSSPMIIESYSSLEVTFKQPVLYAVSKARQDRFKLIGLNFTQ